MTRPARSRSGTRIPPEQTEAMIVGTRAIGALIAESMASVDAVVSMPQLRVLVIADDQPQSVSSVARDLGVHPSNATRTCERLVRLDLLDRREATEDRRRVVLTTTAEGARLVERVMRHRRARIREVLSQLDPEQRAALASAMLAFARAAADEPGPPPEVH
jgi:DNA-binding MarR family transcriptional regulator